MSIHLDSALAGDPVGPSISMINQHLLAGRRAFLGYLRRRLGSIEEAEDVLQNFSVKVIRAAGSARHDEKVNVWMSQILRNALIDHYRRRAARQSAEATYARELVIAEVSDAGDAEAGHCRCLRAALSRLPAPHAELLRRADLEEEPRARIAADAGLTLNALNVRLHRARKALRVELESSCPSCRKGHFMECDCG